MGRAWADQLTLFTPGAADFAHHVTASSIPLPTPDSKSYLHLYEVDKNHGFYDICFRSWILKEISLQNYFEKELDCQIKILIFQFKLWNGRNFGHVSDLGCSGIDNDFIIFGQNSRKPRKIVDCGLTGLRG